LPPTWTPSCARGNRLAASEPSAWPNRPPLFLIYPPQLQHGDLNLLLAAAAIAEAYQRHCVDLRDLRLVGKFDYFQVPTCGNAARHSGEREINGRDGVAASMLVGTAHGDP
jgi:hypothetical protein